MSHLVEFSKNKYKRHKHRTVRRPHTPWQVTAARTTETSTRAAGDEGLSDAQSTMLSECYGLIPGTNRKFRVYLAAIWQHTATHFGNFDRNFVKIVAQPSDITTP